MIINTIKKLLSETLVTEDDDSRNNQMKMDIAAIFKDVLGNDNHLFILTDASIQNNVLMIEGEIAERFKFSYLSNPDKLNVVGGNFELSEENMKIMDALRKALPNIKQKIGEWI